MLSSKLTQVLPGLPWFCLSLNRVLRRLVPMLPHAQCVSHSMWTPLMNALRPEAKTSSEPFINL
jgi:hypothetical protein